MPEMFGHLVTNGSTVRVDKLEVTMRVTVTAQDGLPILSGVLMPAEALALIQVLQEATRGECGRYADPHRERPLRDPVCHEPEGHSGTHVGIGLDGERTGFYYSVSETGYRRILES